MGDAKVKLVFLAACRRQSLRRQDKIQLGDPRYEVDSAAAMRSAVPVVSGVMGGLFGRRWRKANEPNSDPRRDAMQSSGGTRFDEEGVVGLPAASARP